MTAPNQERKSILFRDANRLLGFSVAHKPDQVYEHIKQFPFELRANELTKLLHSKFEEAYGANHADLILLYGFGDTSKILSHALDKYGVTDRERAAKLAHDERTINAFARMARNTQEVFNTLVNNGEYRISTVDNEDFIDTDIDPRRFAGCPAVKVENGSALPLPIFKRFVPWAGEIAIDSYFEFKEIHSQS